MSEEVKSLQAQYDLVSAACGPLASKTTKSRPESIALTHLETAMLWLGSALQAAMLTEPK